MPKFHKSIAKQFRVLLTTSFMPRLFLGLLVFFIGVASLRAENRTVRVGLYENAPKVFSDKSGKPSGIFIDIIEDIAKSEGWSLKYVPGSWAEGLDRLEKGEIDLMPDVAYTAERERLYSFHKVPVLSSWYEVYAPKGSNISSIFDLNKKKILVLDRSVQQQAFARLSKGFGLDVDLVSVSDYKAMFETVAKGEADAAITNRFYGLMHAKLYGMENTAVVFEPSDLFFAAPKKDSLLLLNAIDGRLAALKKDPESAYYISLKRWTSEAVHFKLPEWLRIFALAAALVLLISLGGSFVLKHQVDIRTRELRQINQEIEQRIKERTAELAVAKDRAESADRLKSAFLATMSHELRTPLNSIIGFTGILMQGLAGAVNPEQAKQLGMVQNSANHLLSLINDVLDISKIEAGQLEVSLKRYDFRQSINKVAAIIRPLAEAKKLELRISIAPGVNEVVSDQRRVEQIVLNLLNNAVKFTEKGSVHLECHVEGDAMVISIADTGIGIRPNDLKKLFKPFSQIDTGLSRNHEGTGLGLAICNKLVEKLGGAIRVESNYNAGSTFTVSLPIIKRETNGV
jgi:signal transduction histidine kinase